LRQGPTGAIVVIEADVNGHHFRVTRIADTDDDKVFDVHPEPGGLGEESPTLRVNAVSVGMSS
jgi:hypothetical protein